MDKTTQTPPVASSAMVRPPSMLNGKRNPAYTKWWNALYAKDAVKRYRATEKGQAAYERRKAKLRSVTRKKRGCSPTLARQIRTMLKEGWGIDQIAIVLMVPQSVIIQARDSASGPNVSDQTRRAKD